MHRTVGIFSVALAVALPAVAQSVQPAPPVVYQAAQPTMAPPVVYTPQASRATTPPQAVAPVAPPTMAQGGQRTPAPPAAVAAQHAPDPRIDQSDVNIKLTVKITDSGVGGTQTKTVSLIMANKGSGRVRSQGNTLSKNSVGDVSNRGSELNVDANASLLKSGVISTWLTISYTPEWTEETTKMTGVSQQVSLYLKDGVPTIITQAADPTKGSRSVSIEVTASVMK